MANTRQVELAWRDGMRFEGGAPGGATILVDGEGEQGPSPMQTLLLALAGCTASDVVSILRKKRADVRALRIEVVGERRDTHPRRYTAITLTYHLHAPGLGESQARHAIELSLERYCSVTHSLAPDIAVQHDLVLEA
jgi:putative redox protein